MKIKISILIYFLIPMLSLFGEEVVIIGDKVNLRVHPNTKSKIIKSILIGETFLLLEESNSSELINNRNAKWYRISNASTVVGWVFGGYTSKYTELSLTEMSEIGRKISKRNPKFAKELSMIIISKPNIQLEYGPDTIMSHTEGRLIEKLANCYLSGFKDFETSNRKALTDNIDNAVKNNDAKLLSAYGNCSMSTAICDSGVFFEMTNSILSEGILDKINTHKLRLRTNSKDLQYVSGDKSLLFEIGKTETGSWTWTGVCLSNNIFNK